MCWSPLRETGNPEYCQFRVGGDYHSIETPKGHIMSAEARTILVVTDDAYFSGHISERLLRAGIQTIRFARIEDAREMTLQFVPDLVLLHAPRDCVDVAWACYEVLLSSSTLVSIPVLIYTPPVALAERFVGAPDEGRSADRLTVLDILLIQLRPPQGTTAARWLPATAGLSEQAFPSGRDDL
jgi:hypothetical protein